MVRQTIRYKNSLIAIRNIFLGLVGLLVGLAIMIGWSEQAYTYSQENVSIQVARMNQDTLYSLKQGWITEEEANSRFEETKKLLKGE